MSDKDKTPTLEDVNGALKELREEVEKKDVDLEKVAKLEEILNTYEEKNVELVKTQESAKQEIEDFKERIEDLEKKLSRPGNGSVEDETKAEYKALSDFITKGAENMTPEDLKYLRSDNETDGGVLAPAEFVREIIKDITEISALRSVARIRTTSAGRMEIPVRNSLVVAEWEGEGETSTDSNSQYGIEKIPVHKLMVTIPITIEELMDSAFDMEAEINSDLAESFNQKEGNAFIQGDSIKKPEGILVNTALVAAARTSGDADEITFDSLILLTGDLKTGYNPLYLMNRLTIAIIRTLKDGVGQYLWQAGNVAAGVPNQINGFSYMETPDMDDIAANAFPVAFGDFRMGYLIGDSLRMDVIRDPFTLKKQGKVEFTFTRRVGGQVVNAEAIKLLKIAT